MGEANMSLLDRAMALGRSKTADRITDEQIEVAVAWAKDELSFRQVAAVGLGREDAATCSVYCWLAFKLREGVRRGMISETR